GRQDMFVVMKVHDGDAELVEVIQALALGGRFADLLHGRQEQADQDGDDGDYHQQLDQRNRRTQMVVAAIHEHLRGGSETFFFQGLTGLGAAQTAWMPATDRGRWALPLSKETARRCAARFFL